MQIEKAIYLNANRKEQYLIINIEEWYICMQRRTKLTRSNEVHSTLDNTSTNRVDSESESLCSLLLKNEFHVCGGCDTF